MYQVFVKTMTVAGLVLAVFLAGASAGRAASECKGLEKQPCESKESCSWVRAYKTSKGREVSAFCRKKPGRDSDAKAAKTKG